MNQEEVTKIFAWAYQQGLVQGHIEDAPVIGPQIRIRGRDVLNFGSCSYLGLEHHPKVKEAAKQKESIFRENPYHPSLETHKLHGKDSGAWAFWINNKYRIKFVFLDDTRVLFLDIGTYDIYS